ncbi:neuritin isoform X1 [Patagioenas fasciata]
MPGKETHTHRRSHILGRRIGRRSTFQQPPWRCGRTGALPKRRRGGTPPAPAGHSDISATLPGIKPGPRDTTASPVPVTGRRALRDEHALAWCPGIPSRPRGGGCYGCVRGAARQQAAPCSCNVPAFRPQTRPGLAATNTREKPSHQRRIFVFFRPSQAVVLGFVTVVFNRVPFPSAISEDARGCRFEGIEFIPAPSRPAVRSPSTRGAGALPVARVGLGSLFFMSVSRLSLVLFVIIFPDDICRAIWAIRSRACACVCSTVCTEKHACCFEAEFSNKGVSPGRSRQRIFTWPPLLLGPQRKKKKKTKINIVNSLALKTPMPKKQRGKAPDSCPRVPDGDRASVPQPSSCPQITAPQRAYLVQAVRAAGRCDAVFRGFSDCLLRLGDNMAKYPQDLDDKRNLQTICTYWDDFHACTLTALTDCQEGARDLWEKLRRESKNLDFQGSLFELCGGGSGAAPSLLPPALPLLLAALWAALVTWLPF